MPDALAYERVALRYPGAASDAVGPVSFCVRRGERVLLLGPSGAGKSSLLHAATGLLPEAIDGIRRGEIRVEGQPAGTRRPAGWADTCGYLFQDAAQTLAGFTVRDEVAFALENRAVEAADIPGLVARAMARAGLPTDWAGRRISNLSGGERQLVALAALLAQDAAITLADEPAASLAPQAARRMTELVLARGRTALVVEHKPGPILDRIDRCLALGRDGRIIAEGPPSEVLVAQGPALSDNGIALPLGIRLHLAMPEILAPAADLTDSLRGLAPGRRRTEALRAAVLPDPVPPGETLVALRNADCAPAFGPVVLRDITLSLCAGEVLAILGPNGAGKSTLAACLAGLLPPHAGQRTGPPGAVAFQNPEAHFSHESVAAEITAATDSATASDILARWGLTRVAGQHPFTLSQGQKRRLALALLTETGRWPVLILDEPTGGLDGAGEAALGRRIRALARGGYGVAVITHDLDFALSVADRAVLVAQGALRFDGACPALLRDKARLAQAGLLPPEAAPLLGWLETAC